jgi:hypothetical protein
MRIRLGDFHAYLANIERNAAALVATNASGSGLLLKTNKRHDPDIANNADMICTIIVLFNGAII